MSTSEDTPLYAAREPIFPRRVSGRFRRIKWWVMGIALAIYYITPWIRWDRGPNLPDQAVLVDLANRRFYWFWIEIWPQEFYFVAGLLIMAGLGLFLFTSVFGRVWCGYACPQTVWTDLFIHVERWIEGDRNQRIRLWKSPWTWKKIRLRLAKWTVWLLIAMATGGAWVFYFTDAPTLARELVAFDAPWIAYSTIAILTATTFVFGGFMREQVCIYMCPWPRIQAAMMDEDSLTVAYRWWRGEPRGKHRKKEGAEKLGDCIDCGACVAVCPMGIDIRDGQQLACITCALCIDACDAVMEKIGKPRGLIDYLALSDEKREVAGLPPKPIWQHVFRPRVLVYFILWAGIGAGLIWALFARPEIDFNVSAVRNPLYVTLADGSIRNTYDFRLRNKHGEEHPFRISLTADDVPLRIRLEGTDDLVTYVPGDSTREQRVFVIARKDSPAAKADKTPLRFWVEDVLTGERAWKDVVFFGKGAGSR